MVSNEADPTAGEREGWCDAAPLFTGHNGARPHVKTAECRAWRPIPHQDNSDPMAWADQRGRSFRTVPHVPATPDAGDASEPGLDCPDGCPVCDPEDASTSASEPLSEDEREVLWQAIWQTLADHQWADWECSCGCVRKGSGEYEDNHLADVLTDLVAAREAKARAEAGEQIAQAIEALPLIDPSGHPLHDQVTGQQMRHFAARIARLTGVTR